MYSGYTVYINIYYILYLFNVSCSVSSSAIVKTLEIKSSDINTTFVALTDLEKKKPFNEMSWSVWVNTSEAKAVVTKKRRAISERLIPFS